MTLPLTDQEKAETVRRLLEAGRSQQPLVLDGSDATSETD